MPGLFLLVISLFIYIALVKLLVATDKPAACAGTWTVLVLLQGLLTVGPCLILGIYILAVSAVSYGLFRLLNSLEGRVILWVPAVVIGFPVVKWGPRILVAMLYKLCT